MNDILVETSTAENDADNVDYQPIEADRKRRRTKWSNEMNEHVVRSYYRITRLETLKIPYAEELHRVVLEAYPELRNKTIQNVLDQRRSLMYNARITAERLQDIKDQVSLELGIEPINRQPLIAQVNRPAQEETNENPKNKLIKDKFTQVQTMYDGIQPNLRPQLPKLRMRKDTKAIINRIDNIIATEITPNTTLEDLHLLVYAGAYTALVIHEQKVNENKQPERKQTEQPIAPWERRLNNKINSLRKEIGQMTQSLRENAGKKVRRKADTICKKYSERCRTAIEVLDYLKQQLAATSKRTRRYKKNKERRTQNKQFNNNEKLFYRNLNDTKSNERNGENEQPEKESLKEFWENIWSNPIIHRETRWVQDIKQNTAPIRTMEFKEITANDIEKALKKAANWKAPGPDHVHNFWYKKFKSTHQLMAILFTDIINHPDSIPQFMTSGVTYLLPKTIPTSNNPAKYRPITCLPTLYKILTAVIAEKIYNHLDHNQLLDEEQKGCRKGSRGCKEQLIIDGIITTEAKKANKSLYMAYVDYQKAYDSVPHTWLVEVLKIYQVNPKIRTFLQNIMTKWETTLRLNNPIRKIEVGKIGIKRGIFQGDSLSPVWFCLALKPLTTLLNRQQKGYTFKDTDVTISHLLYMDDLKLYATSKKELDALLHTTEKFSTNISMNFGIDKCRTCAIVKGKWEPKGTEKDRNRPEQIPTMEEGEYYKYLGFMQAGGTDNKVAKEQLTRKYTDRLKQILHTQLTARNKAKAINTYCSSVLMYSFGVTPWTATELEDLDIKTRTLCTKYRYHHPKSSKLRFHLPRAQGGRGITQMGPRNYEQIDKLRKYFYSKAENSPLHRAAVNNDRKLTPLNLRNREYAPIENIPTENEIMQRWKAMPLHGKYPTQLEARHIDAAASHAWLHKSNLYSETEGFMLSIQDQVVPTKHYRRHITNVTADPDDRCRICKEKPETIDHIISGCTVLAPTEYTLRHNNVAKIIHQQVCRRFNVADTNIPYYKYVPDRVIENDQIKIYWDWSIITDKEIRHNRPDIVIEVKNEKHTYLIDIAVPLAANIEKTNNDKISKYLPLAEEVRDMWKQERVIILPLIIGATGEIPKKLYANLETLKIDKNTVTLLQKSVILDTCHIVRKVISGLEKIDH